ESPAVDAAVPLPVRARPDLAIEPHIGWDDAIVVDDALPPGTGVFEYPLLVFRLPGAHVSGQCERDGHQVLRVVADDVGVVLEVGEHLLVARLAVAESEPILYLDWVACPVEGSRLAEKRAAAAVEHAADNFVGGVVIGRAWILVEI